MADKVWRFLQTRSSRFLILNLFSVVIVLRLYSQGERGDRLLIEAAITFILFNTLFAVGMLIGRKEWANHSYREPNVYAKALWVVAAVMLLLQLLAGLILLSTGR